MENRDVLYFLIMGLLAGLCVLGIVTFIRERGVNYLWRWIYVLGGVYLLFDLFNTPRGNRTPTLASVALRSFH